MTAAFTALGGTTLGFFLAEGDELFDVLSEVGRQVVLGLLLAVFHPGSLA